LKYLIAMLGVAMTVAAGGQVSEGAAYTPNCPQPGYWKHGAIQQFSVHQISCHSAVRLITYALNHGLVRPRAAPGSPVRLRDGYFVLVRRTVRGFRFSFDRGTVDTTLTGRHGRQWVRFDVCWLNIDC